MMEEKTNGNVIYRGNPEEYTMKDLAQKIRDMTGTRSKIVYTDLPEDDPVRRRPDITKAQKLLNWQPRVSLEEGLKQTISYYQKQNDS